ncbi:hypothetical protein ACFQH3_12515 [Haladaptatus sp. GCM10025707]
MSYLALKQRDQLDLITPIPVVGLLGTAAFFPLLLYDLYLNSPEMFVTVLLIGAAVIGVELLYFEREPIEDVLPWMSGE